MIRSTLRQLTKLKYEYVLIGIAIVWVLFFSYVLQLRPGFSKVGDDGSYLHAAQLLYANFKIDNTRPFFISMVYGLPYLFGYSSTSVIQWGIALNFCCWFLTDLFLFRIVSQILDRKKAFLLSLLFLFCIGYLADAFHFLPECIFIVLLVLGVYYIHRYYTTQKHYYITLAIAILLLNALVKPVSVGLAVLTIVFFIPKWKAVIYTKLSVFLLFVIALLFVQMYALKKNYGDFTLSYIGSITYYNYLGAKADCYQKGIPYEPGKNERTYAFTRLSNHDMKLRASADFKDQLQHNTYNLFKAYLYCMYSNSSKGSFIVSACNNKRNTPYFTTFQFLFKAVSKIQNIVFTVISLLLACFHLIKSRNKQPFYFIVSVFIIYLFLISALSCYQCDRFHIVFYPLLFILLALQYKNLVSNKAKQL
jgi:hypothetical protein